MGGPPSPKGQWHGILGESFAIPANGLGKYCELRDELCDRGLAIWAGTQLPMVSAHCACYFSAFCNL